MREGVVQRFWIFVIAVGDIEGVVAIVVVFVVLLRKMNKTIASVA